MTSAGDVDLPRLRHRPPFVFHDTIDQVTDGGAVGGLRLDEGSLHYFDPGYVDGVDLTEALAQVSGIHNRIRFPDFGQGYLVAIDGLDIAARVARPGQIRLEAWLVEEKGGGYFDYEVSASDAGAGSGQTVASGRIVTFRAAAGASGLVETHGDVDGWRSLSPEAIRADFANADRLRSFSVTDDGAVLHRRYAPEETFFLGHFPGEPVVPGVLHLREMARACGHVLGEERVPAGGVFHAYIEKARFNNPVGPETVVDYKCTKLEESDVEIKFKCIAISGRKKISTMNIKFYKTF